MILDVWNPATFDQDLERLLKQEHDLIQDYYQNDRRLMAEHLNSQVYRPLGSNPRAREFQALRDDVITPAMREQRIRAWHYARLTERNIASMRSELEPASWELLRRRLDELVEDGDLSRYEADIIYDQSPFMTQHDIRLGQFWGTSTPLVSTYHGVEPLLTSWGGESAYFHLRDLGIAEKLRSIGKPTIVELEVDLADGFNAGGAASTVLQSWARSHGEPVLVEPRDVLIKNTLAGVTVREVHTVDGARFHEIGRTYPLGTELLLDPQDEATASPDRAVTR